MNAPSEDEGMKELGPLSPATSPKDLRPSLEGDFATAMQMQVELLKRLHQSQAEMQESLQKERRGDLVIQSTRALNESFRGMQKTQEKLLQELNTERARPRRTALIACGAAALVIVSVLVAGLFLGDRIDRAGRDLGAGVLDARSSAAFTELSRLAERIEGLEQEDKALFESELRALRERVLALTEERSRLILERDRSQSQRDEHRAAVARMEAELRAGAAQIARLTEEKATALEEAERLTRARLADQELLTKLNETVERLRAEPRPEALAVKGEVAPNATGEVPAAVTETVSAAKSQEVDTEQLKLLNDLLRQHRSSNAYRLVSARGIDQEGLLGVEVQEIGPDGALAKTLFAERLSFQLGQSGRTLTLSFRRGHVVIRQNGRDLKSPFFRDTYDLVIFGVRPEAWTGAGLPFPVAP